MSQTSELPPGPRVTTFDGTYQGTGRPTRPDGKECSDNWTVPVLIQNGVVTHAWNPALYTTLKGVIAEDGSFSASAWQHGFTILLTGKVDGTKMVADVKGQKCDYHLELTKS
jgi:hypothetical protein